MVAVLMVVVMGDWVAVERMVAVMAEPAEACAAAGMVTEADSMAEVSATEAEASSLPRAPRTAPRLA